MRSKADTSLSCIACHHDMTADCGVFIVASSSANGMGQLRTATATMARATSVSRTMQNSASDRGTTLFAR